MKFLIIIDAQNDFISGKFGSDEAKATAERIVERLKNCDYDNIIVTIDEHNPHRFHQTREFQLFGDHCLYETEGRLLDGNIYHEIISQRSPTYLFKSTFEHQSLAEYVLLEAGNTKRDIEIELCGFCTDICVIANAVQLTNLYNDSFHNICISINEECCCGTSNERHDAALLVMESLGIKRVKNEYHTEH